MSLTQAAYARHRGVTKNAVSVAVKGCRISVDEQGLIDPEQADREWNENTDPRSPRNSVTGNPHGNQNGKAPSAAITLNANRAEREAWTAKLARLDYEKRAGLLLPAAEVEKEAFAAARRVRDALMGIPDRLSPVLATIQDPLEVRRLLAEELRKACEEMGGAE